MPKRPISVTLIACIYLATGALGLVYHLTDLDLAHPFQNDTLWIELVRLLGLVSGAYMLRGRDWARWLALAWIAYHVVISVFHSRPQLIMHSVLCAVFAYVLLRPAATRYFRPEARNPIP